MTDYIILVPIAYLIGSIPFGLLVGKIVARVDIREYGSGKTGMTNVLRTSGLRAAALVLFLDMGKAALAVLLARIFFDSPGVEVAAALAVLFGHNWSVFIKFTGGRGTASGWGGLLILNPVAGIFATIIGLSLVAITRYVSLGSIAAASLGSALLVALAVWWPDVPPVYSWYGIVGGTLIVVRHWDNIQRLMNGVERKIGQPSDTPGGN